MSKSFAALNASITSVAEFLPLFFFLNKRSGQQNERKYIGIILQVNGMNYFAPLSSFKPKHTKMDECVGFKLLTKFSKNTT